MASGNLYCTNTCGIPYYRRSWHGGFRHGDLQTRERRHRVRRVRGIITLPAWRAKLRKPSERGETQETESGRGAMRCTGTKPRSIGLHIYPPWRWWQQIFTLYNIMYVQVRAVARYMTKNV